MTTYNVPYTFIPGTKAKANEVNENFSAVLEHIKTTKENSADINLSNITKTAKDVICNASGAGRLIGELVFSALPIKDANVHLLNGSVLDGNGIYKDFVKYIKDLYNSQAEPPAYFTTEENWQTSITQYGVCGKFVYNATNNTVKLPQITGILEGTTDINALGALVEAGLPNITGQFHSTDNAGWANGAFTYQGTSGKGHWNSDDGQHTITLDASKSSSIYGKSTTVQPQTIKQFVYIVISNSKNTDIMVDIDNIATDLNNKTNTDFSNITNSGKKIIANLSRPSTKSIALTLGTSGTRYTMPADGYLECAFIGTSGSSEMELVSQGASATASYVNSAWARATIPVRSKSEVVIYHNGTIDLKVFKFSYAIGAESEAV